MVKLSQKVERLRVLRDLSGANSSAASVGGAATTLTPQVKEAKTAGPCPTDDNSFGYFASNEILETDGAEITPPDIAMLIGANDFEEDLRGADRPSGEMLYVSWHQKLAECLSLAYALFLHVLLDPNKLSRLFSDPYFSESRKRALPRKKGALAALQYVTKPESKDDRKSASAYATMLVYARHKGITAKDFPIEMAEVTLREARAFVRDRARQITPKKEQEPQRPTLRISYRCGTTCGHRVFTNVSISTEAERRSLSEQIMNALQDVHASTP